jgi:DNA polymerase-3 subunit gamma/tau
MADSLYLKYRPQNFATLVGQHATKTILTNAIKLNRIAHAYLFTGPRGTGKTTSARLIAKALNCENLQDDYEPCEKCANCLAIKTGSLIDVIEIDAASNRGIDEIRALKEKIMFAPSQGKAKVYIIDEVHMLTKEAFNALLKTLEEPPEHAYFILATTEAHKVPETIKSRCQGFDFRRIAIGDLKKRLVEISEKEGFEFDDKALDLIARYVNGGLRDAISILEQVSVDGKISLENVKKVVGASDQSLLLNFEKCLLEGKNEAIFKILDELCAQGKNLENFVCELLLLLREKMQLNLKENKNIDFYLFAIENLKDFKTHPDIPQLELELACVKIFQKFQVNKPPAAVQSSVVQSAAVQSTEVKVAQTQEPKVEAEVSTTIVKTGLTIAKLEDKWKEILEKITHSGLKIALKNCKISNLDAENIKITFTNKFYADQVNNSLTDLEKMIELALGAKMKVCIEVDKSEHRPIRKKEPVEFQRPESQTEKASELEDALEVFGGEVVG